MSSRKGEVLAVLRRARGAWVDGTELATVDVGGSEGLKRLRELRADGYDIQKRKHPDSRRAIYQYRLLVTPPAVDAWEAAKQAMMADDEEFDRQLQGLLDSIDNPSATPRPATVIPAPADASQGASFEAGRPDQWLTEAPPVRRTTPESGQSDRPLVAGSDDSRPGSGLLTPVPATAPKFGGCPKCGGTVGAMTVSAFDTRYATGKCRDCKREVTVIRLR